MPKKMASAIRQKLFTGGVLFFPDHNIRFIAINDCVDSDDGENKLAPF
jgi:hypothetical protein